MIPYEQHLLPREATHLEQVVASVGTRVDAIPTPIETVKGPYTAPAGFLVFDAWEYSVDVWKSSWPLQTKRNVTAAWFYDHSIKGTQRAVARYVGYVGSELLKAYRPPGRTFASPAWSTAEREAWLDGLPQIRVWNLRQRGTAARRLFCGASFSSGAARSPARCFAERGWPVPSDARFRLERRAEMTLDGVVTPVDVDGLGNQADRVRIRGRRPLSVFAGAPFRGWPLPSTAASRIVTFTFVGRPSHGIRFPVRPGLEIRSVVPDYVRAHGVLPFHAFAGAVPWRKFVPASTAALRIYSRISIFDRATAPPGKAAIAFAGVARLGIPPHTAEIQVSIPGRLPARAVSRFLRGHLVAADRERWHDTFVAVRAAKRLSDRILLDPKTYRPLRMGSTLLVGGRLVLGRWTRS